MLLRRLYDDRLAQASYLIGCQTTGEAIVIDPNRDVAQYLEAAQREGVRITHVTETHIHADFLSGARELAQRTGAQLFLSAEGGADWQYAFAKESGATLLHDGDSIQIGAVRLDVWHTPGHTPEHLIFIVTDTAATDEPMGAVTGDFVFVGDVGRPDLLERAAGVANTMERGARDLFRSLRRFAQLPDWIQIWPGHGAGSACGKALGAVPMSTLGYERIANWALAIDDEERFVRSVLAGQPEPPRYFATMKRLNREGPALLGDRPVPSHLEAAALPERMDRGDIVIDTRPTAAYAAGYVPGTLNMPVTSHSFTTWAGSFLPYDRDLLLIAESEAKAVDAARALESIGLDRVDGWFDAGAVAAFAADGGTLDTIPQMNAAELARWMDGGASRPFTVLDVRTRSEWAEGHLPGVTSMPITTLPEALEGIDRDSTVVLQCQGGSRSAVAASLLRANGFRDVVNLAGGFRDWREQGGVVESEE